MYKRRSAAMQRYHKVHEINVQPVHHAVETDYIPTAANMSLAECEAERRQLILEKTKLDNALVAAKRQNNQREVLAIGASLQVFCQRLSAIKQRMHELRQADNNQAFGQAVREIVPPEMRLLILERQQQILAEIAREQI